MERISSCVHVSKPSLLSCYSLTYNKRTALVQGPDKDLSSGLRGDVLSSLDQAGCKELESLKDDTSINTADGSAEVIPGFNSSSYQLPLEVAPLSDRVNDVLHMRIGVSSSDTRLRIRVRLGVRVASSNAPLRVLREDDC